MFFLAKTHNVKGKALNKPSHVLTPAQKAEQRCSAALPQHKYTEGLVPYLTDSHGKGSAQEVRGCMCPMPS